MNATQLKKNQPKLHAQIVAAGARKERSRINKWLALDNLSRTDIQAGIKLGELPAERDIFFNQINKNINPIRRLSKND